MSDRILVRQNSDAASINSQGISVDTEGSRHSIINNAISSASAQGSSRFHYNLSISSYSQFDNNLCSGYKNWEMSHSALSALQNASGLDLYSLSYIPMFTNVPLDFKPDLESPLVGHDMLSNQPVNDLNGRIRRISSPSDIGAYEKLNTRLIQIRRLLRYPSLRSEITRNFGAISPRPRFKGRGSLDVY